MPGSSSQGLQKSAADALRLVGADCHTITYTRVCCVLPVFHGRRERERERERHRDIDTETKRQRQRQRERWFDAGEGLLGRNFDSMQSNLLLCPCHCEALWIGFWATRTGSARLAGVRCQEMSAVPQCYAWLFPYGKGNWPGLDKRVLHHKVICFFIVNSRIAVPL